jgi:hypothetical protein
MKPAAIIGDTMKQQIESAKNFVKRNQTKILITTTVVATSAAMLMKASLNAHDQFLKDNGLYDTYYTPDADE